MKCTLSSLNVIIPHKDCFLDLTMGISPNGLGHDLNHMNSFWEVSATILTDNHPGLSMLMYLFNKNMKNIWLCWISLENWQKQKQIWPLWPNLTSLQRVNGSIRCWSPVSRDIFSQLRVCLATQFRASQLELEQKLS